MRQIEVINQETIIDVSAEVTNVEILVTNYDDDLVEKYALEAQLAAQQAEASATSASGSATTATNQANIATNQALLASAARLNAQNAANAASASEDAAALSASSALASATSAELDAIATAADRVQTGLDRQATGADRVQTGLDAQATAADRIQTGLDAQTATTQAGVATTQAGIATTQAGIATTQAGNALTSANNALNSANAAAASAAGAAQVGTSTLLTGFSVGTNTPISSANTILSAFQDVQGQINARVSGTGVSGQVAFWSGTGTQVGDSGLLYDSVNDILTVGSSISSVTKLELLGGARFRTLANGSVTIGSPDSTNGIVIFANSATAERFDIRRYSNRVSFLAHNANSAPGEPSGIILFNTGNVGLNTTTDAGFRLDVNGTARVQGALTTNLTAGRVPFIGTAGVLSDDAGFTWDNVNRYFRIGSSSNVIGLGGEIRNLQVVSGNSNFVSQGFGVYSFNNSGIASRIELGTSNNNTINGHTVLGVGAGLGVIRFSGSDGTQFLEGARISAITESLVSLGSIPTYIAFFTRESGGSILEKWRITSTGILQSNGTQTIQTSTGNLTLATGGGNGNIVLNPNGTGVVSIADAKNLSFGTTTGTRLGTATNQRLSLWNATPNVQPTTAITAGAFVANTSGIANDTATFDGYTMGQVVAALRRIGALA
jgi:hypothetical protein